MSHKSTTVLVQKRQDDECSRLGERDIFEKEAMIKKERFRGCRDSKGEPWINFGLPWVVPKRH